MRKLLTIGLILFTLNVQAQNIGIGTTTPNASALLDMTSSNKGLLIPRMTTTQRNAIGSPAQGLLVYDSTEKVVYYRSNTQWLRLLDYTAPLYPESFTGNFPANIILTLENSSISTSGLIPVIYGVNRGAGPGVWGFSENGNGVKGLSGNQFGIYGESSDSTGGYFTSIAGTAALVTGNGNVGIGVPYPYQARMVINGSNLNSSMLMVSPGNAGISLRGGGSPSIGFNSYASIGVNKWMAATGYAGLIDYIPSSGDFIFRSTPITSSGVDQPFNGIPNTVQTLMLTRSGLLGVGSITPAYALDVNGRARIRHNTFTSGIWYNKADNTEAAFAGMVNDSTYGFYGQGTGGNWRVGIDVKNAQVGIGITDPSTPLSFPSSIGNKISFYGSGTTAHYGIGIDNSLLQIYSAGNTTDIAFGYGNSSSFTENFKMLGNGNLHLGKYAVWASAADDRRLNIGDGNFVYIGEQDADDRLVLRAGSFDFRNGDVYIGASDFSKGVGFKLRVNGKIITEEVKVQLLGAWPDYVFENGYNKLSINELEKYIQSNKRLPGIPSATEVEKNGQYLGDMQRKMMEKIEELSLYIIELNKKIELQQSEINQLKNK
jgi:hypothetical protein